MKKHTVKFELNTQSYYLNREHPYGKHNLELCVAGLRQFLELPYETPRVLYVTLSSRKFKNSFPMKLVQNWFRTKLLEIILVDDHQIITDHTQDAYLRSKLGTFKNNPTIHILFEIE